MEFDVPVKTVFSREDDLQQDYYRPAVTSNFKGGLDSNGNLIAWSSLASGFAGRPRQAHRAAVPLHPRRGHPAGGEKRRRSGGQGLFIRYLKRWEHLFFADEVLPPYVQVTNPAKYAEFFELVADKFLEEARKIQLGGNRIVLQIEGSTD